MKISRTLVGLLLAIAASGASMASTTLSEGFDDITTLTGKGWSQQNLSAPLGSKSWFQGSTFLGSFDGIAGSHIAADFLSGNPGGGTIDNWLMTPVIDIDTTVSMSFALRLVGGGFLDTVETYYSTSGSSTNVADFTRLNTYSSSTDTGWVLKTETLDFLSGANTGRLAFRYVVAEVLVAGDYIGIDAVSVVPEPDSRALMGLGLLCAAALRLRKA